MRYFYNIKTKLQISDVSGKKTIAQIIHEFGGNSADYQTLDMTAQEEKTDIATIENNILKKKKHVVPVNKNKINYAKLTTQAEKINFIAKRLGLT